MTEAIRSALLNCPLFDGADAPTLRVDLEALPNRVADFPEGAYLAFRNDPYPDLLVLLSGRAAALQENPQGNPLIVEVLEAPQAVASAMVFRPRPFLPVTLRAETAVRIFRIAKSDLLTIAAGHRPVLENLMEDMANRLATLAEKLRLQSFATLRQRLAAWLLDRLSRGEVDRPVAKRDLAELLGVSRPSLSRTCGELGDLGLIELTGRRIVVVDEEGLRSVVGEIAE